MTVNKDTVMERVIKRLREEREKAANRSRELYREGNLREAKLAVERALALNDAVAIMLEETKDSWAVELKIMEGETFWELNRNFTEPAIYPRIAHTAGHCLYASLRWGETCFGSAEEAYEKLKSEQN